MHSSRFRLELATGFVRGYKCGVWAPGFEQFEGQELPLEIGNLCAKVPRERLGVGLLGSAANVQRSMHVSLGQPAEAPTRECSLCPGDDQKYRCLHEGRARA